VSDVKLPVIGDVKTGYVIAGGAVVLGVVGYAYYRHRSSGSSASSSADNSATGTTTSADAYPSDGTTGNPSDPDSTDPATGETYGDEGSFTGEGTEPAYDEPGYYGGYGEQDPNNGLYYDPADGQYDLTSPYAASAVTTPETNSQWSQEVTSGLEALGLQRSDGCARAGRVSGRAAP
jgi:hypothetical protein